MGASDTIQQYIEVGSIGGRKLPSNETLIMCGDCNADGVVRPLFLPDNSEQPTSGQAVPAAAQNAQAERTEQNTIGDETTHPDTLEVVDVCCLCNNVFQIGDEGWFGCSTKVGGRDDEFCPNDTCPKCIKEFRIPIPAEQDPFYCIMCCGHDVNKVRKQKCKKEKKRLDLREIKIKLKNQNYRPLLTSPNVSLPPVARANEDDLSVSTNCGTDSSTSLPTSTTDEELQANHTKLPVEVQATVDNFLKSFQDGGKET